MFIVYIHNVLIDGHLSLLYMYKLYAHLQITKVRRTLTEILLEVTTAEMKALAREALEEYSGKY